jgi:hypothetical protein
MKKLILKAIVPAIFFGTLGMSTIEAHATDPSQTCPTGTIACPSLMGCRYTESPVGSAKLATCCTRERSGFNSATVEVQDILCYYTQTSSSGVHQCENGYTILSARRNETLSYSNSDDCPPLPVPEPMPEPPHPAPTGPGIVIPLW